jgi:cell division topological specificity factor
MVFLNYFRTPASQKTAATAKERLQIIIAHEHNPASWNVDYLPLLRKDLLEALRKYIVIENDQIKVHVEKKDDYEILELNIILPELGNIQLQSH